MPNEITTSQSERGSGKSVRLHYLDWLQVLAILGVFLYHALQPFQDLSRWHIKNAESSAVANIFIVFFAFWGMPFFFLMAGATSWFSLRRRTPGRYIRERVTRLLIPFIIFSLVLTPIQAYYEFINRGFAEMKGVSIIEFIFSSEARTYFFTEFHPVTLSPRIFGNLGYHLWFVGFLFAFSLLALPLFLWLKGDSGKRFLASLARLTKWRGGLLVFVIPLVLIQLVLRLAFPADTIWADFFNTMGFFVSGYILIAEERFMPAIRRDWPIHLILGVISTLFFFSFFVGVPVFDWSESPGTLGFYVVLTMLGINGWCWTMVMLYIGMRFLDYTNKWLQYGREASYPFFIFHQPAIIFVAFYAVQWQVHPLIKLLVVVTGAFALTIGLYELLVRRINPVRALFGMKAQPREMPQTEAE
jgi:peptidoglycan/LPS O-acetylase OafA/YrhL